jgi:hypothetical protein
VSTKPWQLQRNWLLSLSPTFLLATEIACAHPKQPPPQAANVGFTTPALIADFSASNASGLINCNIGDQSPSTFYFQGTVGRPTRADYTCSQNARFMYDSVAGKRALELRLLESQIVGYPCDISGALLCNGTVISTAAGCNFSGGNCGDPSPETDYPMGYYEFVYRLNTPNGTAGGNADWSFWSWVPNAQTGPGCCGAQHDVLELDFDQSQGSDASCDNGGLGVGDWYSSGVPFFFLGPPNCFDARTQYAKVGVLYTGNASVMHFCFYLNDVQQQCADYTPKGTQATQRRYIMLWIEPKCGQNDGDATCFGSGWGEVDLFVQSVRIFTCADWQTSMCYTE